jgi:hypothetical protein
MNTDARSAGLTPYTLPALTLFFLGGGRGAWLGEVAEIKLPQGEMPILYALLLLLPSHSLLRLLPCHSPAPAALPHPLMVSLLSLRVLAPHLRRLCLLYRRLLHRLLSWVRHLTTFAFSTGACCTASSQARQPATCAFSTGACCTVPSQARHSAACASPAEACCTVPFPYLWWGRKRTAME